MTASGHDTTDVLGGPLSPEQLAGREYSVKLAYLVEYEFPVFAGVDEQDAIEQAELRRDGEEPVDRDLIHAEVDDIRAVFADDPRAERCFTNSDGPTAPSEDTFWDDERHFGEEVIAEYTGE